MDESSTNSTSFEQVELTTYGKSTNDNRQVGLYLIRNVVFISFRCYSDAISFYLFKKKSGKFF